MRLVAFKLFFLQSLDGAEGLIASYKSLLRTYWCPGFGNMLCQSSILGISWEYLPWTSKSCVDTVLGDQL